MSLAKAKSSASGAAATFKPRDVEELVDFYFHRRAANLVVRLLAPTSITPNQVTVMSGGVAIVAGLVIATAHHRAWALVLGAGIFFFSVILDCVDGQLARLRRTSSLAGRALDGFVDVASVAALMIGQLGWMLSMGVPLWLTMIVGWPAAFSLRWHAHTYDHVKNVYLHNTTDPRASEIPSFPTLQEIDEERQAHERAGRRVDAVLLRAFGAFTEVQRRGMTNQAGHDRRAMLSPAARLAYRERFHVYMRLWSWNGMGTHLFLFTLATLAATAVTTAPLWAWAFVAAPLNLYTVFLVWWRPRLEQALQRDLERLGIVE